MFANLLVDRVTGVPSVDGRSHEVLGRVLQPVYERVRLPAARRVDEPAVPLRTWRHLAGNTHGRRPPKGYRRITCLLYSCTAGRIVLALSSSSSFYLNQATWPIHRHTKTYRYRQTE